MDIVIGGLIGIIATMVGVITTHFIAKKEQKNKEIRKLSAEIESYIPYLGTMHMTNAQNELTYIYYKIGSNVSCEYCYKEKDFNHGDEGLLSKTNNYKDYLSNMKNVYVGKVSYLCRLKKLDYSSIENLILEADIDITEGKKQLLKSTFLPQLRDVFTNSIEELEVKREEYIQKINDIMKNLLM